jgi:hypothetical protein
MATNTYVALQTQTLTTTAASITFSSINQGYTDLVIIAQIKGTANTFLNLRFNGDTGSNYSRTVLSGDGSTVISERRSNQTSINTDYNETIQTNLNYITTLHIMNYANSTTNKTVLCRPNNAATGVGATVGLWRNTAAITSVSLVANSNSFDSGSTFTLYGIAAQPAWAAKATGGTITNDVQYTYHTFTSSGTFTPTQALTADCLVIAGGGSGGYGSPGGGGAGGLAYFASQALTSGAAYTITVGAGAAASGTAAGPRGNQGSNSVFGSLTAAVGGGWGGSSGSAAGGNGGSGGGANEASTVNGLGTASQGNDGGDYNGGGGGAGAAGANGYGEGINGRTGLGGVGSSAYSSWGSATSTGELVSGTYYYAGGGGGYARTAGSPVPAAGGYGGGKPAAGAAGTANTGGASGADSNAAGGSGIVIIRYAN